METTLISQLVIPILGLVILVPFAFIFSIHAIQHISQITSATSRVKALLESDLQNEITKIALSNSQPETNGQIKFK